MRKSAFFTTFEISQICGVNPTTVQNWVKTKRLKAFQTPGKHRRVCRDDLIEFLRKFDMPIPPELNSDEAHKNLPAVLIVDDDTDIRSVIADALRTEESEEISIREAKSSTDALLSIGQSKPDMIILDVRMPDMNGFDVCERLKANDNIRDIKIVAISGDHRPESRERILAAGADMFFTKPLDLIGFRDECFQLLEVP